MIIVALASLLCFSDIQAKQSTHALDFMPHKTARGKLAFSWHNLNPVNVYRVLTTKGERLNLEIDPKDNCKTFDDTKMQCTECKEGFYLESDAKVTGYCVACEGAVTQCSSCKKSATGKVQCEVCSFPYMPNAGLDTCVQRITLYWYFFVYLGVAIVLMILTCLEKPKTYDDELFEQVRLKSNSESSDLSLDSREGVYESLENHTNRN